MGLPAHAAIQEIIRLSAGPLMTVPLASQTRRLISDYWESVQNPSLAMVVDGGMTKYQAGQR